MFTLERCGFLNCGPSVGKRGTRRCGIGTKTLVRFADKSGVEQKLFEIRQISRTISDEALRCLSASSFAFGEKMDEVSWRFIRINWTLYYDSSEGLWMAFSSNSDSHRTAVRANMESWLADMGLGAEDIAKLFCQAEKTGEAALTVARLHEPPTS